MIAWIKTVQGIAAIIAAVLRDHGRQVEAGWRLTRHGSIVIAVAS